ncbi:helix-turn-helix domain-containing protein [Rhodospira trueperi]|uniref:AraC family transcriptional regulator, transcriptional activator of the genes for pyochelin and ferripyochelin receptors n=1 Tax=Rhodospira trueperi TaxID=69960 RepID=A0A1G7EP41_9PROT|nr:AraC family transcriptional regulator [Rhodospira trueperi]SDE65216.1 AraC family transcriptional regulator, transcriptional activator of the genes for pyochelin and ferripyochelin receptors [Rhodospira trueperi]
MSDLLPLESQTLVESAPSNGQGVCLADGTLRTDTEVVLRYPVPPGLYVSFALEGCFRVWINGGWCAVGQRECLCVYHPEPAEWVCHVPGGQCLRIAGAFLSDTWLSTVMGGMRDRLPHIGPGSGGVWSLSDLGPAPLAALQQGLRTDMPDSLRAPYQSAKALEFLVLLLRGSLSDGAGPGCCRFAQAHRERVRQAHDILERQLADPPALGDLARMVGLGEKALNAGFRHLYAATVFEVLTDLRLTRAHHLIVDLGSRVSVAAYAVGLTPAHLSQAFRKRYGVPPSALRGTASTAAPSSKALPRHR